MERYFQIAGLRIRVELPEDVSYSGDGPLVPFAAEPGHWDYELIFRVVPELSDPEGEQIFHDPGKQVYQHGETIIRYDGAVERSLAGAISRICRTGNRSDIQITERSIPAGITSRVILNGLEIDHLITRAGGVILHSSYIIQEGRAMVFTAPSGTGKSTQAALWERYQGAQVINGDRSILMPEGDCVMAHGLPFSGTSGICQNQSAPLKGIVYLTQAKENVLTPLKGMRAFRSIWEGCNLCRWDEAEMELAANTVMTILNRVPVYHLACRPDEDAVNTLSKTVNGERK